MLIWIWYVCPSFRSEGSISADGTFVNDVAPARLLDGIAVTSAPPLLSTSFTENVAELPATDSRASTSAFRTRSTCTASGFSPPAPS